MSARRRSQPIRRRHVSSPRFLSPPAAAARPGPHLGRAPPEPRRPSASTPPPVAAGSRRPVPPVAALRSRRRLGVPPPSWPRRPAMARRRPALPAASSRRRPAPPACPVGPAAAAPPSDLRRRHLPSPERAAPSSLRRVEPDPEPDLHCRPGVDFIPPRGRNISKSPVLIIMCACSTVCNSVHVAPIRACNMSNYSSCDALHFVQLHHVH